MLDDMCDSIEVERRQAADTGERYPLEDVIAELGITEEEIAAADSDGIMRPGRGD